MQFLKLGTTRTYDQTEESNLPEKLIVDDISYNYP